MGNQIWGPTWKYDINWLQNIVFPVFITFCRVAKFIIHFYTLDLIEMFFVINYSFMDVSLCSLKSSEAVKKKKNQPFWNSLIKKNWDTVFKATLKINILPCDIFLKHGHTLMIDILNVLKSHILGIWLVLNKKQKKLCT